MPEPTSTTSHPIPPEDLERLKEEEAIRLAVADLTLAWANIENGMVIVLSQILREQTGVMLSSAIFFTPAGIEGRIKIVDNALQQLVNDKPVKADILAAWQPIMNTLNRLRKTRNKVAHGQLVFVRDYPRLMSPVLSFDSTEIETIIKGQKPGLGSNEIRSSVKAVNETAKRVMKFAAHVQLIHEGDYPTLLEKLAAAAAENPNLPGPDNPTPPAP